MVKASELGMRLCCGKGQRNGRGKPKGRPEQGEPKWCGVGA